MLTKPIAMGGSWKLIDRRTFVKDGAIALSALALRAPWPESATVAGRPFDARRLTTAPSARSRVLRGATLVDLQGKWIVPGFIDMHVHGCARPDVPLELYVAMGVTSVRDLGGNLTALRLVRKEVANAARLGPRLFFAVPMLDGDPPSAPRLSIIADTPVRASSAAEFLLDQGVDTILRFSCSHSIYCGA